MFRIGGPALSGTQLLSDAKRLPTRRRRTNAFAPRLLIPLVLVIAALGIAADDPDCEAARDLIDEIRDTLDAPPKFETDWDDAYMRTHERTRERRAIERELEQLADELEDCC